MASGMYNRGKLIVADGSHTWASTGKEVILVTGSYTPDDAHNVVSDLTNELSGGGYVRGTLAGMSVAEDDANDQVEFDATDQTFSSLGAAAGTPRYAVIVDSTGGSDATDELICWCDLSASAAAPNGGDYTIQWGADGCFTLS